VGSQTATPFLNDSIPRTDLAKAQTQVKILVPGHQSMVALLGDRDQLLKTVEAAFDSQILVRGNEITITGDAHEAERVATLFEESVAPKTLGQKRYVDALRRSTLTFSIGPAGTGKTYLAVATAVRALQEREVNRIILSRPAVEAGEKLGFLPGTLFEKIDPYMRPLYDALYEMMDPNAFQRLVDRGTIEIAPLAYLRGRTLNDSFIILDEAQNTSPEQMKMFLTRLGFGSKAAVNGDITQIDLPPGQRSGLVVVQEILRGIEGIEFIHLGARDVVRHRIVQDIVEAYRRYGEERMPEQGGPAEHRERRPE
jgi:phosphate starvation-inducible PhoH-like protein